MRTPHHQITFELLRSVFLFAVLLLAIPFSADAQKWAFELWHEGKIVTIEGDTLKGNVKYDLRQDFVQLSRDNQTFEALSARKVLFFEIYDRTVGKYRRFFALPYSFEGTYEAPYFFELLEEGKLTLLAREQLEYRNTPVGYYGASYSRLVMIHNFFILNEKGEITLFRGRKQDLMQLMGKYADPVDKYIRKNRLSYEEKYDFARIIAYYNSLQG